MIYPSKLWFPEDNNLVCLIHSQGLYSFTIQIWLIYCLIDLIIQWIFIVYYMSSIVLHTVGPTLELKLDQSLYSHGSYNLSGKYT